MAQVSITGYSTQHRTAIRQILGRIGWAERQYILAAEQNAEAFSKDQEVCGVYIAVGEGSVAGFVYLQCVESAGADSRSGCRPGPPA
ncbi:MAG: hypothetical protein M3362_11320 [Acidobacteriota bacterium]|nr:hypothetical protein [Acidobacteriota bacterium]